ncbi:hypothetical protein [Kordiimonas laminariae]|uniref:hypothetical protein n=1 Tax=Kordiimonas laminariae TaxID=2917717 RepID=UPI001FF3921F|nr:hypothetical protein [Kordiimonas laminariae]MCK0068023.1 hypothetical protein [Kordiimonas laminariae]
MLQATASVGPKGKNAVKDIFVLQLALKVMKNKRGRPYFTGPINGRMSRKLSFAIEAYYDENNISSMSLAQSGYVTAHSINQLVKKLPAKFQKTEFLFDATHLRNKKLWVINARNVRNFKAARNKFPLPKRLENQLENIIQSAVRFDNLTVEVVDIDITSDGRFVAELAVLKGECLDLEKAEFCKVTNKLELKAFLQQRILARSHVLWKIQSGNGSNLFLQSRVFPEMVLSTADQREILEALGGVQAFHFKSITKCLLAYENKRRHKKLSGREMGRFQECFGPARKQILDAQVTRKLRCKAFLKKLDKEVETLASLLKQAAMAHTEITRALERYVTLLDEEFQKKLIAVILTFVEIGASVFGLGAAVRGSSRLASKAEDVEVAAFAAGTAYSASLSEPQDTDLLLTALGGAAMIAAAIASGPALILAVLVGVAVSIASLVRTLTGIDDEIDIAHRVYQDAKFRLYELEQQIPKTINSISVLIDAMSAGNCLVSLADFDLNPEEDYSAGMRALLTRVNASKSFE